MKSLFADEKNKHGKIERMLMTLGPVISHKDKNISWRTDFSEKLVDINQFSFFWQKWN